MKRNFAFVSSMVLAAALSTPALCATQNPSPAKKTQKLANPLNDLLDDAQHSIDKNDFEAAVAPLQKFLAEKPDVAFAHSQLGYVFTALKRTAEARAEYERAVALDPKMSEAWLNLGILLIDTDPAAAVTALKKAVDQLPTQSRPRFLLGVAQDRSGDLPGAIESLEGASHLDPRDVDTLARLGTLYLRQKDYERAEIKFRAVLAIQPKHAGALGGLAQSLDAANKPEAEAAYRAYLEVQLADDAARARLIHFLMEKKEYAEALAELDKSETAHPATLTTLKLRADIQISEKKYDDAIATLRRALALNANDSSLHAELHAELGRMYLQKRDFPDAEKELQSALKTDPNNVTYWKDLSSTYYLEGNCPDTIRALDVLDKTEKPAAVTWFIRGLCYDKMNQTVLALSAYQKFLDMDQNKNPDQVWQAQQRSKVLRKKQQKR
ncbi:MAG TPA: tetratricopeptide repeat protein [Candidatus Dormibacteraeota bacterium]|nr:tetratricopeptide repeat protein [Candidatus Dormibacteraeota bacterium]